MTEKLTPTPLQREKIQRALAEPTKRVLIGDDPGEFGKTLVTAEILTALTPSLGLIVGIKDTYDQWADRIAAQSEGRLELRRIISSTKAGRENFDALLASEPGLYFIGSQLLASRDWELRDVIDRVTKEKVQAIGKDHLPVFDKDGEPVWERKTQHVQLYRRKIKHLDVLVVDELHIPAANRKSNGRRTINDLVKKSEWFIGLSGTIYGNDFANAWSVAQMAWPDRVDGSFIRWRAEWCSLEIPRLQNGDPVATDRDGNPAVKVTGEKNPGAFFASLPCFIRSESTNIAPPPIKTFVELTPEQRAQYESLERSSVAWLEAHTPSGLELLVADLPPTQAQRLRTAALGEMRFDEDGEVTFDIDCKSSKLERLAQVLESWGPQPAIVFTASKRFARVVHARMERAGMSVALWTGDVSSKRRDEIKADFMAGRVRYIVAVIAALSTGYDGLQTVCSKIAWLDEVVGNPTLMRQARDRIWRPGVDRDAFQEVKILANDTLDKGVLHLNDAKGAAQRASLRPAA